MNKLNKFPHVYYVNLDHRIDRKKYMEDQFKKWNIEFTRVSSSKYLSKNYKEWEHLLTEKEPDDANYAVTGNAITHIEIIKNWLNNTDDDYMIMMEDDYDLNLIEYWNFDWNTFMHNLPYDWDCILLGYEDMNFIRFFLHPIQTSYGFGPCLINRYYAKKLVRLHYFQGKFKLPKYVNYRIRGGHVDYIIAHCGRTYCIPLITTNPYLGSDAFEVQNPRWYHIKCRDLYYDWWKNESKNYTTKELLSYGKINDERMTKCILHLKKNIFNYE